MTRKNRGNASGGGLFARTRMSVIALLMVLALAGCDGGNSAAKREEPREASGTVNYAVPEAQLAMSNAMDGGYSDEAVMDMAEEEMAYEGDAAVTAETAPANSSGTSSEAKTADRKIIWSGYLRIESVEYEKTLQEVQQLMARYNAVVENSQEYDDTSWYTGSRQESSRSMIWNIRVPSASFGNFFEDTGSLTGQIRSKNTSSSDRTKQYSDTAVQIESLTIQQENLMKMMEQAKTIEDMLAIEDRLTEVRTQLRYLTNSNSEIDYDVEYSSVTVELQEVHVYQKQEISYWERLKNAFGNSLIDFVEALGDFVVTLIYMIPYIIVIGLVLWLLRGPFRRFREKRREKKAKKAAEKQAAEK